MQIVIDIPKTMVQDLKDGCFGVKHNIYELAGAVCDGIVLPKGHGRLIDADMLDDVIMQMNENGAQITRYEYKVLDNVLFEMPTIVEADKAESEEE